MLLLNMIKLEIDTFLKSKYVYFIEHLNLDVIFVALAFFSTGGS